MNYVGKLKGHVAQVTSILSLKNTPLLISADEAGVVKTWDMRNLTCY
ncbi:MAG: hypothetical protein IPK55_13050 [Streptococcus sp.]|nr:hypothetical protein [Streptococcus sp.]